MSETATREVAAPPLDRLDELIAEATDAELRVCCELLRQDLDRQNGDRAIDLEEQQQ